MSAPNPSPHCASASRLPLSHHGARSTRPRRRRRQRPPTPTPPTPPPPTPPHTLPSPHSPTTSTSEPTSSLRCATAASAPASLRLVTSTRSPQLQGGEEGGGERGELGWGVGEACEGAAGWLETAGEGGAACTVRHGLHPPPSSPACKREVPAVAVSPQELSGQRLSDALAAAREKTGGGQGEGRGVVKQSCMGRSGMRTQLLASRHARSAPPLSRPQSHLPPVTSTRSGAGGAHQQLRASWLNMAEYTPPSAAPASAGAHSGVSAVALASCTEVASSQADPSTRPTGWCMPARSSCASCPAGSSPPRRASGAGSTTRLAAAAAARRSPSCRASGGSAAGWRVESLLDGRCCRRPGTMLLLLPCAGGNTRRCTMPSLPPWRGWRGRGGRWAAGRALLPRSPPPPPPTAQTGERRAAFEARILAAQPNRCLNSAS